MHRLQTSRRRAEPACRLVLFNNAFQFFIFYRFCILHKHSVKRLELICLCTILLKILLRKTFAGNQQFITVLLFRRRETGRSDRHHIFEHNAAAEWQSISVIELASTAI